MRPRSAVLLLLGAAAAISVLRRRRPTEFVDVQFEDGSGVRLVRGVEAGDLLDDAAAILDAA
ncbi:MAG: hypothetical protein ACRDNH_07080 [Gaiellaceae bacterium]